MQDMPSINIQLKKKLKHTHKQTHKKTLAYLSLPFNTSGSGTTLRNGYDGAACIWVLLILYAYYVTYVMWYSRALAYICILTHMHTNACALKCFA